MKHNSNNMKPRKAKQKKKLTYAQQKFKGLIKSEIGPYKPKIWPNQAIQEL